MGTLRTWPLLHAAPREELAQALADLSPTELGRLVTRLGDEALADIVAELDAFDAARLLGKLGRAQAADVLEEMDPDDAADVMGELDPSEAEAILHEMEQEEAQDVRELLNYPPESAAGIMTPDFVAVAPYLTADEALAQLGRVAEEAETIYYVYVTEPATGRLLGVLSLRSLVLSPRWKLVSQLMYTGRHPRQGRRGPGDGGAPARQEQLPGAAGRRRAGSAARDHHRRRRGRRPPGGSRRGHRAPRWLAAAGRAVPARQHLPPVSQAGTLAAGAVRGWGVHRLGAQPFPGRRWSRMVALTFFIPLLIGIGGNVGSQTVTTLVRAMGVGEVQFRDLFRVFCREAAVGVLLGLVMAGVTFTRACDPRRWLEIGPVVAVTALFIVVWAATVAAVLPLVLHRIRDRPGGGLGAVH